MNDAQCEALFRSWLRDYSGIVSKIARAFTTTESDRDDLIQEILLRLWTSIRTFRGEAKPSTWIYRIAFNRALTWQRDETRKRRKRVAFFEAVDPCDGTLDRNDRLESVYAAIRQLDEIDRSLILMSLDGCTYREIAEVMDLSETNVGARLSRIKQKLARKLTEDNHER